MRRSHRSARAGARALRVGTTLILGAIMLSGCAEGGGPERADAWHPNAACPAPVAVGAAAHIGLASFAQATGGRRTPASTGCTYAAREATVAISVQPGGPSGVDYNLAAGIHDSAAPGLGAGAHIGTARYFCGAAVPASSHDTLTVTITTRGDETADCGALTRLVRLSATWH